MHYLTESMSEFLKNKAILLELDIRKRGDVNHNSASGLSDDGVDFKLKGTLMLEREPLMNRF